MADAVAWSDLAELAKVSKMEFEAEDIDLDTIITNNEVFNPGMPTFRMSVLTLRKTKVEVIDLVRRLSDDDLLAELRDQMLNAKSMFEGLACACGEAERRLTIGLAVLAYDEAKNMAIVQTR